MNLAAPGQRVWWVLVLGALWLLSPVSVGIRESSIGFTTCFVTSEETTDSCAINLLGRSSFLSSCCQLDYVSGP